jgi:hypothetical protein
VPTGEIDCTSRAWFEQDCGPLSGPDRVRPNAFTGRRACGRWSVVRRAGLRWPCLWVAMITREKTRLCVSTREIEVSSFARIGTLRRGFAQARQLAQFRRTRDLDPSAITTRADRRSTTQCSVGRGDLPSLHLKPPQRPPHHFGNRRDGKFALLIVGPGRAGQGQHLRGGE